MRALLILLAAVSAVTAVAQPSLIPTLLYQVETPHPARDGNFGFALATVGDLDGDGTDDLVVGAPNEDAAGGLPNGRAYLVSGATGAVFHELVGAADADGAAQFGDALASVGDLDGDGVPDVAVGARSEGPDDVENGAAYVFSGATGSRLYRWTSPDPEQFDGFGGALIGPGDLTGDGLPDVAVRDRGALRVYDGTTGLLACSDVPGGGTPLVRARDVDGDGVEDIVGGRTSTGVPGSYAVYSGAKGALLFSVSDPEPGGLAFAWKLASAGDLDGDGLPEMAASAYRIGADGRLLIFDGATGALVRQIDYPHPHPVPGSTFAFPRGMAAGDADGDGIPDLAVGAVDSTGLGRSVYVFSGANGAVLARPFSEAGGVEAGSGFGETLAFVRETDGSSPAVLAVGAFGATGAGNVRDVGRLYVFALGGSVASAPPPEVGGLSVSVSPNPSSGAASVAVSLGASSSARVAVVDALGRTVAVLHDGPVSVGVQRLALPVGLAAGVYAVVAEGASGRASARWVVAR